MDDRTSAMIDILCDYNHTLEGAYSLYQRVQADDYCDGDTEQMAEDLIAAILVDHSNHLIPESEQEQVKILAESENLGKVILALDPEVFDDNPDDVSWGKATEMLTLLNCAALSYAMVLSQTRWGRRPWGRVMETLLMEGGQS